MYNLGTNSNYNVCKAFPKPNVVLILFHNSGMHMYVQIHKSAIRAILTVSGNKSPHHNHFMALFWDQPGEPVPEENFWTLWCKGRLTEANTPTIRLGTTPFRLTTVHLHHPHFLLFFWKQISKRNKNKAHHISRMFTLLRSKQMEKQKICIQKPQ